MPESAEISKRTYALFPQELARYQQAAEEIGNISIRATNASIRRSPREAWAGSAGAAVFIISGRVDELDVFESYVRLQEQLDI